MNKTMNGSSCSFLPNPTANKIGETFAYCLFFVVSLVGNSLIGIIVYKTQTLRKPINYFIVNMAMSDLLIPIFVFPRKLTRLYVQSLLISGPLGQVLCKLPPFLWAVSNIVSIQSLVLIAVDRLGAVVFPLRSPIISSRMCPFFILATWITAMTVFSPYFFVFKLVEYPEKVACEWRWNEVFGESLSDENYFLTVYVVFFYVPTALLVILYSIIVVTLKTQKIPGEQSVNAEQRRARRNRNVLKFAIAVVLGFVLCWVPVSVINLQFFFAWDRRLPCGVRFYHSIANFVAVTNCAINPCICFIFGSSYRQGLKRLLKCPNAMQNRVNQKLAS